MRFSFFTRSIRISQALLFEPEGTLHPGGPKDGSMPENLAALGTQNARFTGSASDKGKSQPETLANVVD
ncbi:MAG: hypothetical protein ABSH28_16960 [Acidobacteriota bacterium]|jgi:hypothetical protein